MWPHTRFVIIYYGCIIILFFIIVFLRYAYRIFIALQLLDFFSECVYFFLSIFWTFSLLLFCGSFELSPATSHGHADFVFVFRLL